MDLNTIIDHLSWIPTIAGAVWVILSAIFVYVLLQIPSNTAAGTRTIRFGLALLLFIWLYPIYTYIFPGWIVAEVGNIVTLLITLLFVYELRKIAVQDSKWLWPQIAWNFTACVYGGLMLVALYG